MQLDKVYVVTDNCVWDYEENSQVVAIATTRETAQQCFNDYVEKVKQSLDFGNLELAENEYDDGYVIIEDEDYFEVYLNGDYITYHTVVSLYEKELVTEKEKGNDYGF